MIKIKKYLIIAGALLSIHAYGQVVRENDTVVIGEVVIRAAVQEKGNPGFKVIRADSSLMQEYILLSIADMLAQNSSLFIKSYGSGGTATPSLRGTGAGNTRVTWNGISLDNPMLGQPDLSILPAGFSDDVSISYGGASMDQASGTAGGIVSFVTNADWNRPSSISLATGIASFDHYSGTISARTGNEKYRSVTKGFFQSAENDFPYINRVYGIEPITERRKNSQMTQFGFLQELYYRDDGNNFAARLWYQKAARNLPSSLLQMQSANNESQEDESLRLMLDYSHGTPNASLFLTGALVTDRLDYTNQLASIDSRNFSSTIIAKGGIRGRRITKNIEADLLFNEELNSVSSNNYENRPVRNSADVTASVRTIGNGTLTGSLLVREILYMNKFLFPDLSAGMQLRPFWSHDYILRANIARTSGIPTLNDLFWSPGGNPELKNEYAWMFEAGYEISGKIDPSLLISNELTFYRNSINDMIQWRPGDFSWWEAQNIGHVNTHGLEASLSAEYRNGKFSSLMSCSYSYTIARDAGQTDNSKQLVYVPVNQFNIMLKTEYGPFHARWRTSGNGIRYTVPDNSKYLPGYVVSSAMIGATIGRAPGVFELNFQVENVFNKEYETIAYYPLPGRTYSFRLLFQIKTIKE